MTTQKEACALSDGLNGSINDLRALLGAAEDQLCFYLSNRRLLGEHPNGALLGCCASQAIDLLALCQGVLSQMDERADALADYLYHGAEARL